MSADERRRLEYLSAMGIQAWSVRSPAAADAELPPAKEEEEQVNLDDVMMSSNRGSGQAGALSEPSGVSAESTAAEKTADSWSCLKDEVTACVSCALHQTRTQTVFGVGDRKAGWMVIGEAPGEQEDLQGEPFVGRAGLLLNEMLRATGLLREQVYIANILKCRPPKNRDPSADEAAACEGFLKRQLALVRPRVILAVGRIAAQNLLKCTTPIGKLRGLVHDYQGTPLVVTYHPAYLLRSPLEKRRAWDDLRLAMKTYDKSS